MWFSRKKEVERGAFVRGAKIFFRDGEFRAATANANYAAVGSAAEGRAQSGECAGGDFDWHAGGCQPEQSGGGAEF